MPTNPSGLSTSWMVVSVVCQLWVKLGLMKGDTHDDPRMLLAKPLGERLSAHLRGPEMFARSIVSYPDTMQTHTAAHNVVHFAIHADDVERARRFYTAVFGWRFQAWGPPGFFQIFTGTDEHPGIEGALHERHQPLTGTGMRGFECTVCVNDLLAIEQAVLANGGTIMQSGFHIVSVGTLLTFLDTEGNTVNAMKYDTPRY
jgi:uncharacterized protein